MKNSGVMLVYLEVRWIENSIPIQCAFVFLCYLSSVQLLSLFWTERASHTMHTNTLVFSAFIHLIAANRLLVTILVFSREKKNERHLSMFSSDLISMAPNWWGVLNANCNFNTKRMGWNLCFSHNIIAIRSDRGAVGWLIFNYLGRSHCELVRAFSAWIYRFPIMWGWEGGRQDRDRVYLKHINENMLWLIAGHPMRLMCKTYSQNHHIPIEPFHSITRAPAHQLSIDNANKAKRVSMTQWGGRRERDEK